jgi:predicted Rossmann fold flavoprotein
MKESPKNTGAYDVIVVGGGSAGLMAAGRAAELGKRVLLLEKNRALGEKLKISGGGRCNITNAEYDVRALLSNYGEGEQFLYSAFAQFGVKETFAFFEKNGLPLVVQARKRAFPNTEKAIDVFRVLERYVKKGNVTVKTGSPVLRIKKVGEKIASVVTKDGEYSGTSFIFATGGVSHPETGSTGDGFKWLETLGHPVATPTPNIVPLSVKESWVHALAGVSLSFMKISFFVDGKRQFSKTGKVLFTHFGLSGPLILNSAHQVSDLLHAGTVTATIDCYPDTEIGTLDKELVSHFEKHKNKMVRTALKEFLPVGTADAILSASALDPEMKVHSVPKESRRTFAHFLKALPVTITGLMGYDRAVVADGGVSLLEIDTKTMRSMKVKNLFIIGDLLHIRRPSGGYSLQLCWTSGWVAGTNA